MFISDNEKKGERNVHYHFKVDVDVIKNLKLDFEWSALEYYLDTSNMVLMRRNIWLRYRQYKQQRHHQYNDFFILQIGGEEKSKFVEFIGIKSLVSICDCLNDILSKISNEHNDESDNSDGYVHPKLTPNDFININDLMKKDDDLLPWCIMYTNRYYSNNGFYIDVCKFYEHDHSFYIIGGVNSESFKEVFYIENDIINSNLCTSISKPMQYMKLKYFGLYEKFGKPYEVKDASDNLLIKIADFKNKLNLDYFDLKK